MFDILQGSFYLFINDLSKIPRVVFVIQEKLSELTNFKSRSTARKDIISMGAQNAGAALLDFFKDEELKDNTVWAVVVIFQEWAWQDATEMLISLLESRTNLRGDISRALQVITSKNFGLEAADWRVGLSGSAFYVELKQLFGSTEISEFSISDDRCKIIVNLDGSRRQQVLLFTTPGDMRLYTECGVIGEDKKSMVEKMNETLEYAELLCEASEDCYKVTLTAPVDETNSAAGVLKEQIMGFARISDTWEQQLTGQDNI